MLVDIDSVDPGARNSAWARIAENLTGAICAGDYPPGSRLPPESALADRFGVNRHTVRRALAALAARGMLRIVQGSGSYVEDIAVDLVLARRTRHALSLRLAGLPGSLHVLASAHVRAVADVARVLGVPVRSRVLRILTLGEAKGWPLHVAERYFPLPRFKDLDRRVASSGSITKGFAALGVPDYVRRESRISALLPPAEIAALLAQPAGRPALCVQSLNEDLDGTPIESATGYFAGDRVALTVRANE